jgi:hypothetical protein
MLQHRSVPFVILAIETGTRYGVIQTLQWDSVDILPAVSGYNLGHEIPP